MIITSDLFLYFRPLLALGIIYTFVKLALFGRREKNLPPGPPTAFVLGNAHQIAHADLYKKFKEWSETYGEIFSLKVGRGTMIVLNSKRVIHELVDKRSAIYSARPEDDQARIVFRRDNFINLDTDANWRAQRKTISRFLSPMNLDGTLGKIFEAEVLTLLHDLLTSPKEFSKHIERTTASFAAIALYGQRAKSHDDFWVKGVYEAMDTINRAISPGSYLPSEQFPIFKLIPRRWTPGNKRAHDGYNVPAAIWAESKERVDLRRARGDKRESLLDQILDEDQHTTTSLYGTAPANFLGTVMQGAADTNSLAMHSSILFLANHPWVQEKAQKEIDAVCGVDRLPTFADFQKIPYINCILKEGLRIRPVVPMGFPHRCKADNWYKGMLIANDLRYKSFECGPCGMKTWGSGH